MCYRDTATSSIRLEAPVAERTGWLSRYRWMFLHSVRMTTAGNVAFASAYALGLPEALSAAITAIVVT
jgi:uncharacterized membrane protein YccC